MTEIIFLIEEAAEGGYTARALGESIFTEGDDEESLKQNIRDAIDCHYQNRAAIPKVVRMHWVKDEVLAL